MGLIAVARLGVSILSDDDQVSVDSITLFVALLCGCIVIGHLLEESRWINESITALFIGLCTGGIILLTTKGNSSHILEFDEQLFFIYVLPPIIFNAGFQVKKKQFFRNFMTIMLFGAFGTLISFSIISFGAKELLGKFDIGFLELRDYLAIGAIFSATDSVCTLQVLNQDETPRLYSLVFGEGVVNDATSVVLFNAIQKLDLSHINPRAALLFTGSFLYLFLASTFLGVLIGLLSAYLIKKIYLGRHSTDREVALVILMAYLSYVMAELFDLSGILTVFICGIVMSHYTWHNVTTNSKVTTRHTFATLSFIAEIFIFLYVGMDALDIEKWRFVKDSPGKSVGVSAALLGLVLVGRACFVFPLSLLSNCLKRSEHDKFGLKQQVTIWWAGLMRGSVSMALAYNQFTRFGHTQQPGNAVMITSTITIVLFSTVVFGLITKPLVRFLLPSSRGFSSLISSEQSFARPLLTNGQELEVEMGNVDPFQPASLSILLNEPSHTIHNHWRRFDDAFMRPLFGGRGFVPDAPELSKGGCDQY
ncbi:sodium/hydrogen exchanger 1-like isoform X2 [Solanum dulcamara]|nr:sodium/hydrogen exchanger 1-like isoform X2 [Solanum dulcamara]XP_055830659.1 sodium/hydrogen exchanger 1-like isoform X2 [Solanum dulcamara]